MSVINKPTLQVIKQLLSELRHSGTQKKIKDSLGMQYILNECRKHKTTELQFCKAQEEMKFMANTYLCYLQSKRKYNEILIQYTGKGERSIEETANLVGFKLPHDPKP